MALRLTTSGEVDPAEVPLPSGTEVVTGVDREIGGRVRRQGAVGRVVTRDGATFEVAFVFLLPA